MPQISLSREAHGLCIVCWKNAEGSLYWTPMPLEQWKQIRPLVMDRFEKGKVQNIFFDPTSCNPFCGPVCATKYKEMTDGTSEEHKHD